MMCRKQKLLLIISFFLTSCTVGPDYHRPGVTLSAKFKEARGSAFKPEPKKGWCLAKPQDQRSRGEWWKIFHDPELNALEEQLNLYNQNIANALANYIQSQAIVDEARASYFPSLSGAFSLFRQRQAGGTTSIFSSENGTTSSQTAVTGTVIPNARTNTSYSAFLNASWEPDIWGLVRRTVEANVSAAEANQALLAATALSVQGSLAQYYFELRALDRDQQLLNDTVVDYKKVLQLTHNLYNSGVASRADIVQAQGQLETAQAQAINNGILRSQYEHAIAVLIGRPPANFAMRFKPLRSRPPVIPVTIPSVMLERRPDVAQAERLMQQANAQIGVAIAAYYPSLNLSATASASGSNFYNLIHTPAIGWSSGLQLAETIFDAGFRSAVVSAARAGYMAQIASYRQTVLAAFQDVEDNLVALRLLKEQSVAQDAAAASARKALQLVINQYKAGTVPYSSVITAQITSYNARKAAYDVVGLQMTAAVGLVKALGGGWSLRELVAV